MSTPPPPHQFPCVPTTIPTQKSSPFLYTVISLIISPASIPHSTLCTSRTKPSGLRRSWQIKKASPRQPSISFLYNDAFLEFSIKITSCKRTAEPNSSLPVARHAVRISNLAYYDIVTGVTLPVQFYSFSSDDVQNSER